MATLNQEILDFVTNRIQETYPKLSDSDVYQKRSGEIDDLYCKIVKDISPELEEKIEEYIELQNLNNALAEEEVYKQGFADGMNFSEKLEE